LQHALRNRRCVGEPKLYELEDEEDEMFWSLLSEDCCEFNRLRVVSRL
jgi:hypothetical protein